MSKNGEFSFAEPPLVEVALSIQFRPLERFHIALLGVIWDAFKSEYPNISYEPRLEHVIERFGIPLFPPKASFKLMDRPEAPRMVFTSVDQQYVIQIQDDRFILNWRQHDGYTYPRHEKLAAKLFEEFSTFRDVLARNEITEVQVDQIEITNVNHIEANAQPVEQVFDNIMSNSQLNASPIEAFSCNIQQSFSYNGKELGRIYTVLEKSKRRIDFEDMYAIKITARAHPFANPDSELKSLFSALRTSINGVFDSVTTTKFQKSWGRE